MCILLMYPNHDTRKNMFMNVEEAQKPAEIGLPNDETLW